MAGWHTKGPALSGLVVGTVLTTRNVPTTFAFNEPWFTAIALLTCAGCAVLLLSKWLSSADVISDRDRRYEAIPLNEVGEAHDSRQPSPVREDVGHRSSSRILHVIFLIVVVGLCLRVASIHIILQNVECSALSWEPLVILGIAAWDYWTVQRKKRRVVHVDEDEGASLYEQLEQQFVQAPYAYLIVASILSLGGLLLLNSTANPRSTFVCAAGLHYRWLVPLMQRLGSALDVVIIICISQLQHLHDVRGFRNHTLRLAPVGYAFLTSAAMLSSICMIVYFNVLQLDSIWTLTVPRAYFWSVLELNTYTTLTVISALILIHHVGTVTTTLLMTFISLATTTTLSVWRNAHPFPPIPINLAYTEMCVVLMSVMTFFYLQNLVEDKLSTSNRLLFKKMPALFYLGIFSLFLTWTLMWGSRKQVLTYHPIDMLIYEANGLHQEYLNGTSRSNGLAEAVEEYRTRYGRHPPPGFDAWYKYAADRDSTVIDNFDTIDRDLQPFRAVAPSVIRERTWQMTSNSWNNAAGITIRDGQVGIIPNVPPTHRWMLDGIVEMIEKFSQWLPDMDLAFNINDEPRVSVPFEVIEPMRNRGRDGELARRDPGSKLRTNFSLGRAEQWKAITEDSSDGSPLQELSMLQIFHRFGSVGCSPHSAVRLRRLWDWGSLCLSCVVPHSLGIFLANWTMAADICHQPDLADLHGLYLSPAAFKGAHELYPIFSQSKAHGFNDILYPSAWNYLDKARYDPSDEFPDGPFLEKQDLLFWRGATSEGVSAGRGEWRGMARQRFVHLVDPTRETSLQQPILVPTGHRRKLKYLKLPVSKLSQLLPTDVHFVDSIVRCGGKDCPRQDQEFRPMSPPTDFQSHWRNKYLLDLDGAGFSGRFLPFLRSRSLPFKASLFREWWDDRVTPWVHFVPLDLRAHGFWATLAYFHGVHGDLGDGTEIKMAGHAKQAERIAEAGRDWAGKVLRKEDMEIYFFRLLLEWGRLTDDARDEIGFVM